MRTAALACAVLLLLPAALFARAQDTPPALAPVLIPGEDWQVVADNLGFADGLSADEQGNVYFVDLKAKPPTIWKLSPDGDKSKFAEGNRSGTRVGPDGKLYACGGGKVCAYDLTSGKEEILADKDIQPNDLTVSPRGLVYFTETGKKQVTVLDPKTKEVKPADTGTVSKPNGIGLRPDGRLVVSDYGGLNVWSFAIAPDGTLTDKQPTMTMKAPEKKPDSASGDGLTTDTAGRTYVTTALGLQIFSPTGELLGTLPKPQPDKPLVNAAFGGQNLAYLYLANGDKLYRRKTNAKGYLSFQPPPTGTPR